MKKVINIEGMVCMNCVNHVKKALEAVSGVSDTQVDLEAKTATVNLSADVAEDVLRAAVEDAGYEVTTIQ